MSDPMFRQGKIQAFDQGGRTLTLENGQHFVLDGTVDATVWRAGDYVRVRVEEHAVAVEKVAPTPAGASDGRGNPVPQTGPIDKNDPAQRPPAVTIGGQDLNRRDTGTRDANDPDYNPKYRGDTAAVEPKTEAEADRIAAERAPPHGVVNTTETLRKPSGKK